MKIHKDIVQGTEDWFQIKWGKIGGTRSKGLLTKGDTLKLELLAEITEDFELEEDGFINTDMQRGIDLEPLAFEKTIEYTGINFYRAGWLQSEYNDLLGISPDGISECLKYAAEIKCPASKKHIKTILEGKIPSDHLHQCIHYFTVNDKLEKLFFISYRPEAIKKIFVAELNRDSLVNIGTDSKPVLKSVNEVVAMCKLEADKLLIEIKNDIEKLKF